MPEYSSILSHITIPNFMAVRKPRTVCFSSFGFMNKNLSNPSLFFFKYSHC